jgi:hypothetical protein
MHSRRHLYRLVAGAAGLKEDFILPLESDFAIIQPPRCVYDPIRPDQLLRIQPGETSGRRGF